MDVGSARVRGVRGVVVAPRPCGAGVWEQAFPSLRGGSECVGLTIVLWTKLRRGVRVMDHRNPTRSSPNERTLSHDDGLHRVAWSKPGMWCI